MKKLTQKQRNSQEEAYARDMKEIHSMDIAEEETRIVSEIELHNKNIRTCNGSFEDAYGGPIVVPDETIKALAQARCAS